jgi:hypothetical protein
MLSSCSIDLQSEAHDGADLSDVPKQIPDAASTSVTESCSEGRRGAAALTEKGVTNQ